VVGVFESFVKRLDWAGVPQDERNSRCSGTGLILSMGAAQCIAAGLDAALGALVSCNARGSWAVGQCESVPLKGAVGIGNRPAAGVSGVNFGAAYLA
jgi:hypothetical protein